MLIDTHAHLISDRFNEDREQVIKRAMDNNVKSIIEVGTDLVTSQKAVDFVKDYNNFYCTVGVHPHYADNVDIEKLRNLSKNLKVVGIGEIGLDFYRNICDQTIQVQAFCKQLDLALDLNLPVIIHCRDAYEELVNVLEKYVSKGLKGLIHAFYSDIIQARTYIDMGFLIGIGGPVTYPKNVSLRQAIKELPLNKIVLETDCPYLPPQTYRGKRNEPAYVKLIAEKIAEVKNVNFQEVENATTENVKKLFRII